MVSVLPSSLAATLGLSVTASRQVRVTSGPFISYCPVLTVENDPLDHPTNQPFTTCPIVVSDSLTQRATEQVLSSSTKSQYSALSSDRYCPAIPPELQERAKSMKAKEHSASIGQRK